MDVYEDLKKNLREHGEEFGPAYNELQKQIKNIEIEFTQFVTLNTSGDPVEAREVLEQAEQHTYEVEDLMKRIPAAYEELNRTFPEKRNPRWIQKLLDQKYVFPEANFQEDINRVKNGLKIL